MEIIDYMTSNYNVLITLTSILLLIWGIYNKIRYLCIEKASEMVSKIEDREDLTGEQKFALCVLWINESLPKVFRNSIIEILIEKAIQYAYDNSHEYMNKYVKRKTDHTVPEIINELNRE